MTEEVLFDHLHAQLVDYTLQNNKVRLSLGNSSKSDDKTYFPGERK